MKQWKFNPNRRSRILQNYDEFSNSNFASDTFNALDRTYLGTKILDTMGYEKNIVFSRETMGSCYGQYIPSYLNLKDVKGCEDVDGLIVLDTNTVDSSFLPFILSHEGFHSVQDRPKNSGLVPMVNSNVIYNRGVYQLSKEEDFVKAFKTMERSCDVVAITITWEMYQRGHRNLFIELLNNAHTRDIASCVSDAGAWAKEQPGYTQEHVINHCLLWGNVGGLYSETYNAYLDKAAKKTFKDTSRSTYFKHLPSLSVETSIEFNHFSLVSGSVLKEARVILGKMPEIEKHALDKRNEQVERRAERVRSALEMVKKSRNSSLSFA